MNKMSINAKLRLLSTIKIKKENKNKSHITESIRVDVKRIMTLWNSLVVMYIKKCQSH